MYKREICLTFLKDITHIRILQLQHTPTSQPPSLLKPCIMVAVKSIVFTLTTAVLAVNADWYVSFTYKDGGQVTSSGFLNSGCVDFDKTNSDIVTMYFESNVNSDTVELYASNGCDNKKYTAGAGSSNVPNAKYLSYKVY